MATPQQLTTDVDALTEDLARTAERLEETQREIDAHDKTFDAYRKRFDGDITLIDPNKPVEVIDLRETPPFDATRPIPGTDIDASATFLTPKHPDGRVIDLRDDNSSSRLSVDAAQPLELPKRPGAIDASHNQSIPDTLAIEDATVALTRRHRSSGFPHIDATQPVSHEQHATHQRIDPLEEASVPKGPHHIDATRPMHGADGRWGQQSSERTMSAIDEVLVSRDGMRARVVVSASATVRSGAVRDGRDMGNDDTLAKLLGIELEQLRVMAATEGRATLDALRSQDVLGAPGNVQRHQMINQQQVTGPTSL